VRDVTPKPDRPTSGKSTTPAAPATAEIDSVAHAAHAAAAPPDHLPPVHGAHAVAPPPPEKVPLRQGTQAVRLAMKLPALHEKGHAGDVARPTKLT
jgi:hypothetical protein